MEEEIKFLELVDSQCDEITVIESNIAYKKGKRKENGKLYNNYRYNGIVFSVPSDSPFVEDQRNGTLYKVKLKETTRDRVVVDDKGKEKTEQVSALEFDNSVSTNQTLNREKFNSNMRILRKIDEQPITEDTLRILTASSAS